MRCIEGPCPYPAHANGYCRHHHALLYQPKAKYAARDNHAALETRRKEIWDKVREGVRALKVA